VSPLPIMNGAPVLSAEMAPRYSFTTWNSTGRRSAPYALWTLMPVYEFERLRSSLSLPCS
jgi:hypothetical protein